MDNVTRPRCMCVCMCKRYMGCGSDTDIRKTQEQLWCNMWRRGHHCKQLLYFWNSTSQKTLTQGRLLIPLHCHHLPVWLLFTCRLSPWPAAAPPANGSSVRTSFTSRFFPNQVPCLTHFNICIPLFPLSSTLPHFLNARDWWISLQAVLFYPWLTLYLKLESSKNLNLDVIHSLFKKPTCTIEVCVLLLAVI